MLFLGELEEMKKNLVQKRESTLLEIKIIDGIQKIKDQNFGISTMQEFTKMRALEFSHFQTGQNLIFMRNKGLRNIETKMVRVNQSATSDPTISTRVTTLSKTHGIVLKKVLTDIPNGTKAGERIGQKVFIKNCKLKFYCQAPPVKPTGSSITVPSEVFMRFMIVREKEALGSSVSQFDPTVYHVHQDNELDDNVSPNQPSTQDSRMAFIQEEWKYYNSKFADNYKILWRKTIKVSNEEGADHLTRLVKCNIRVNQPAHWDSSNARGDGHVYLFYWCDVTSFDNQGAEVLGHIPLVWLTGRTTFTDI